MSDNVKDSKTENFKKTFVKFFKDILGELKKVIWPNRTQLVNNTVTVLTACVLVGAIIWAADQGLGVLTKFIYKT